MALPDQEVQSVRTARESLVDEFRVLRRFSRHLSLIVAVAIAVCGDGSSHIAGADGSGFPLLGKIKPRSAVEIASSSWSVGGETLDRDFAVYNNFKKYLGPLGAKAIRLQAGWAKCEKTPGVYDWAWLDEVVDDALAQGVRPWLETSYGNPIYEGGGGAGLGGGLPKSAEALAAWDHWVRALVRRYKDRVDQWEIWNEPDLVKANTADGYAAADLRLTGVDRREVGVGERPTLIAISARERTRYNHGLARSIAAASRCFGKGISR